MALDLKGMFGNIPPRQRYLLLGVIGAGIVAAYVYLLMLPLWESKSKLELDLQKLQADLEQKRMIAANLPKLEEEIKA